MLSETKTLTNEWVQVLDDQTGVILPPTKPVERWQTNHIAIENVNLCVGVLDDANAVLMPSEGISFQSAENVWLKATYGNPRIGIIK